MNNTPTIIVKQLSCPFCKQVITYEEELDLPLYCNVVPMFGRSNMPAIQMQKITTDKAYIDYLLNKSMKGEILSCKLMLYKSIYKLKQYGFIK